jgi:hypothetical protein
VKQMRSNIRRTGRLGEKSSYGLGIYAGLSYVAAAVTAITIEGVLLWYGRDHHGREWLQLCAFWFVFLAGAFISYGGNTIRAWDQLRKQHRRDEVAEALYRTIVTGGPAPPEGYFLYLRPFVSTGKLRVPMRVTRPAYGSKTRRAAYKNFPELVAPPNRLYVLWGDLEPMLAATVESVAPLIGLGAPAEQIGAGRIATNDKIWRDAFRFLASGARGIFMVPPTRPGTWLEIEHVLENPELLRKCIWIVPPDRSDWHRYGCCVALFDRRQTGRE